ncbi:hypothetical protein BSKO_11194 [Bryopsis sp. KO-2023]|nr:hypothetical protein BSKO_11194 [Bryopsis sp. KO-2023]
MPRRLASKRKRREQKAQQCKKPRKGMDTSDILTPELLDELGGGGGLLENQAEGELVLDSSKSTNSSKKKSENSGRDKKLSKSDKRKLKELEAKKARHRRLEKVFSTLSKHQLKDKEAVAMMPLHKRGQKETRKERLARGAKLEKLGLPVPSECRAASNSGNPPKDSDMSDSSSSDEDMSVGMSKGNYSHGAGVGVISNGSLVAGAGDAEETPDFNFAKLTEKEVEERARKLKESMDLVRDENSGDVEAVVGKFKSMGPLRVVQIDRRPEIEEARSKLPITGMEQEIMEMVMGHDVMVLCGQTGCGKTTQVPQFLFEAGFGCKNFAEKRGTIGVTQPRRVAAISTAKRVADEMNSELGDVVGYQVRYDRSVGSNSSMKFMTDGILMRELQQDFLLQNYSVIIVDEAHERSLNTDLLLGMLSRIVPLRRKISMSDPSVNPLKLIIMSATLRTEDFVKNSKLFPEPPPVINVASRQYPVTVHFSKKTELVDYESAAYRKVRRIHSELPPGGVLVFVTGQREVEYMCKRLRRAFAPRKSNPDDESQEETMGGRNSGSPDPDGGNRGGEVHSGKTTPSEEEPENQEGGHVMDDQYGADLAEIYTRSAVEPLRRDEEFDLEDSDLESLEEDSDEEEVQVLGAENVTPEEIAAQERAFDEKFKLNMDQGGHSEDSKAKRYAPVTVLPLYALLPPAKQAKVFEPPADGSRLIVVATNVAETSITIPNIRYVVDAGRSKQKILEGHAGMSRFEVRWISKAAAEQRAGRAGRTVPGHCYRLFSSAHFNDTFPEHTPPEIVNTPLEGVVLMMKSLGMNKVVNFPFPTCPDREALSGAEDGLVALAAIDPKERKITEMGRAMAVYPVSPRHSRMIIEAIKVDSSTQEKRGAGKASCQVGIVPYAVALAAALNEQSPFVHIDTIAPAEREGSDEVWEGDKDERARRISQQKLARAAHDKYKCEDSDSIGALKALCAYENDMEPEEFCKRNFLHGRNLREMAALHLQLVSTLRRQKIPGVCDVLGEGTGLALPDSGVLRKLRRVIAAGWCDRVARRVRSIEYLNKLKSEGKTTRAVRYLPCGSEEYIYMHPNSALHKAAQEHVVYTEVLRTEKRPYMSGLTVIDPSWLADVAPPMCEFSEPLEDPLPYFRQDLDQIMCWRKVRYGMHGWELPLHAVKHPDDEKRAVAFGKALLEGAVVKGFKAFSGGLVVSAAMIGRPETRFHARLGGLIEVLLARKIDTRAKLLAAWGKDGGFLKEELKLWIKKRSHKEFDKKWFSLCEG